MATVTKNLAIFDGGNVIFELDYDDVVLRLLAIRCINGSNQPAFGRATALANGRTYSRTFDANQTTEQAIPTNAANRLDITIDARGRAGAWTVWTIS